MELLQKILKVLPHYHGIYFQKELEEKAFILGGSNYHAPIQRTEDFLKNKKSDHIGIIEPSYKPGITLTNLNELFPDYINEALKEGIDAFEKKIKGFSREDAILLGVESRTSSPVIIERDETYQASVEGLYPAGAGWYPLCNLWSGWL